MHSPQKNLSKLLLASIILCIVSLACKTIVPTSPVGTSTTGGQPDLVSDGTAWMPGAAVCVEEYAFLVSRVCVENQGDAPADPFALGVSEGTSWSVAGLDVGEENCFDSDIDLSGAMVTADANKDVAESNEDNNTWIIPVPTQPIRCTPDTGETQPTTESSEPTPEPDVSYQGVSFSYDGSLASSITSETIPAEGDAAIDPWATPEHFQFTLDGYPLSGTFHQPRIMVFPVEAYKAINPTTGETIDQLQQLLASNPASPETIPFLPVFNAGQFMRAQVKYLDFQNGSGVRFLTQYGQAVWPINNEDMFYTFQGLTGDGQYYISAILPVSHPSLPDPNSVTMDEAFYDNFMNYVATMEGQLNAELADSFAPALSLLDAMIQSIDVYGAK